MADRPLARPAADTDREAWQTLVVGLPKVKDATGGPARLIALV